MPGPRIARALLAVLPCWALSLPFPPGWAGEARLVAADSADQVVVEVGDADAGEVLEALSARFGFAVEGHPQAGRAMRYSGLLHGSLDQLVERLLRNEEHVVVRSAKAVAGVSKVVFPATKSTEAGGVAPTDAIAAAPSSGARGSLYLSSKSVGFPAKARQQLPQLWSGLD
jgi:hypothetical protein